MGSDSRRVDAGSACRRAHPRPEVPLEALLTRLTLPRTLRNYVIPASVVDQTRTFLYTRGLQGVEAVVVWIGRVVNELEAEVREAVVPDQIARRSDYGISVEVTQEGLTALIASLEPGVFVLCRVHSHPHEAYHSAVDDLNMLISHEGAISIVVPDFAAAPIELERCSVNELCHGRGWRELDVEEIRTRFTIADG